jgi:hypothetical protein
LAREWHSRATSDRQKGVHSLSCGLGEAQVGMDAYTVIKASDVMVAID